MREDIIEYFSSLSTDKKEEVIAGKITELELKGADYYHNIHKLHFLLFYSIFISFIS